MTPTTTWEQSSISPRSTRVDLHVHTAASRRGATRWLEEIGVAESYSEPERVYDLALQRGMDLVAITDHDTIVGALELVERGFENVIVGEEVTTRLGSRQTGCALHVLVWMLTPALHDEIDSLGLRQDAIALAHWLRDRRLPHALAHPLFDLSGRLTVATLEQCLLLFGGFEAVNFGHSTSRHRKAFTRLVSEFHGDRLECAIKRFGMALLWPSRWTTAGSDDHALRNIASAWTEAPRKLDANAFFDAVMAGQGAARGSDATTDSLAHQLVAVAGRFVEPDRGDGNGDSDSVAAAEARSVLRSIRAMAPVFDESRRVTTDAADDHDRLSTSIRSAGARSVNYFQQTIRGVTAQGDLTGKAQTVLNAVAPMVAAQAPGVFAWWQRQQENTLLEELAPRQTGVGHDGRRVLLFVDALEHTSGVSRFIFDALKRAEQNNNDLVVLTCGERRDGWPLGIQVCEPIGSATLPGFGELQLAIPWAPDALEQAASLRPDVIHISTPGPMGFVGAVAAHSLGVPLLATHHTDLPAYASARLKTPWAGAMARTALRLLYERCDVVLARSQASANQLEQMGVEPAKTRVLPAGIDLLRFGPERRDPAVWRRFPSVDPTSVKALYVGRLGAEKNLRLLVSIWRAAHCKLNVRSVNAELIVVGDGPLRKELERSFSGLRAHFLGEQTGTALASLYASSDFFVFPSTTDTLGQAVIEAQASGLPAIVSDVGGPREIVCDQRTGYAIPVEDEQSWVDAIVSLATNAELRDTMGRSANVRAAEYSFDNTFAAFWQAHKAAAGRSASVQERFCLKNVRSSSLDSSASTPPIGVRR